MFGLKKIFNKEKIPFFSGNYRVVLGSPDCFIELHGQELAFDDNEIFPIYILHSDKTITIIPIKNILCIHNVLKKGDKK